MTMNPEVLRRMQSSKWNYAFDDDDAFEVLRSRIELTGRREGLITYSDLVTGVEFRLPTISEQPLLIDVHAWRPLDRAIVGEFLGRISMESYRDHGFMASALAVSKDPPVPSGLFFDWMHEIGALPIRNEATELQFWSEHARLAHRHYAAPPPTSAMGR